MARSLGLSVHTVNERLRDARRKMSVSSSREAARLLLQVERRDLETITPDLLGDMEIGGASAVKLPDQGGVPIGGTGRKYRPTMIFAGVCLMTFALGLLALATFGEIAPTPAAQPLAAQAPINAEVVTSAQNWLALVDRQNWEESYRATGQSFRKLNTLEVWTSASESVHAQFGKMISRTFVSQENLPAPPYGYEVVKFRARYANKPETLETVTLEREDGVWRVVGIMID